MQQTVHWHTFCRQFTDRFEVSSLTYSVASSVHSSSKIPACLSVCLSVTKQHWLFCYKHKPFCININNKLNHRSALAVKCWVIIHCLAVSCKDDTIMISLELFRFEHTINSENTFEVFSFFQPSAIALKKSCNSWTVSHMLTCICKDSQVTPSNVMTHVILNLTLRSTNVHF